MGDHMTRVMAGGDVAVPDDPSVELLGTFATGTETVANVVTELPDVLLLDVAIDDPDVRAVCRRIREWAPATRVLVIGRLDDENLYAALVSGASGALLTDAPAEAWTDAIHAAARGEAVLQTRMASRILHDIDAWAARSADPLYPPPSLTATEREVLRSLADGMSTATIAETHNVTPHLVSLHAGFAVGKLHRYVLGAEKIVAYGTRSAGAPWHREHQ